MTEPGKRNRNTIPLQIPTYWTPEQAFAVFELLDELRDAIWRCYALQLQEQYRDQIQRMGGWWSPRCAEVSPVDLRLFAGQGAQA